MNVDTIVFKMGEDTTPSVMAPIKSYSFKLVGTGPSCLLLGPPGYNWCFIFAPEFQ